ncbi:MAG: PPC domain-containing DNA-binding protein [Sulfolobales archaeon]
MMFLSTGVKRILLLGLKEGDLFPNRFIELLRETGVRSALLLGIGGFRRALIGYFDQEKGYEKIELRVSEKKAIEVTSLLGSVIYRDDERYSLHVHVTLGMKTENNFYATYAGHLIESEVYPLLELFLIELENIDHSKLKSAWPHRYR